MTDDERAELAGLEASGLPRDFKGDVVSGDDRRKLDRIYYLRLRAAGVCTWEEVKDAIRKATE